MLKLCSSQQPEFVAYAGPHWLSEHSLIEIIKKRHKAVDSLNTIQTNKILCNKYY